MEESRLGDFQYKHGKCLEPSQVSRCSLNTCEDILARRKMFNDPHLPKHVNEETVYGIKTKAMPLGDVVFPHKLPGQIFQEDRLGAKLYEVSHHGFQSGEQLKRRYTNHFDPNNRYGNLNKILPAGIWFKQNIDESSSIENANQGIKEIVKVLESVESNDCRFPYVDYRQGKFPGRSYFGAWDTLTGNDPNENEFLQNECLVNINKLKNYVKKRKCDLRKIRETYAEMDTEQSGLLPLDQVYAISYAYRIRPKRNVFERALNMLNAIDKNNVNYKVFMELIDPNVCLPDALNNYKTIEPERFKTSYKTDYENDGISQSLVLKNSARVVYKPVKPPILAYRDCFGYETDVKTLLNPSIFSNYGLTYRDFYIGRDKTTIKDILESIGVVLPDEIFNKVWNYAYQCDGNNDQVSVEVFRQILQKIAHETID
ncbi:uncharacterized protein LOC126835905 [Adelges cooleyi]|uniref:uncharacterized protein LOC126835905 n=1 Tax=Adelges cooleyi TaxID=133065 RepID=UPI00217FF580|nr:uncharacterized protein LOC126835905 [Adelges cooleyi]